MDLRDKFLSFFEEKGHLRYPSASLKSEDPGLLFTIAGMQQFKPYFQGAMPRFPGYGLWHRVATSQKVLRAGGKDSDIENVGRTRRHHTFFEMLGNFSFGDYFKREAITWAWEYLTDPKWLGLDPERLHATVFNDDDEAYDVWLNEVGIPAERLSRWGEKENFWPANAIKEGRNGPCGPCSEIFYDRGPGYGSDDETGPNTGSGDRFVEIWNLVFTQFNNQDGELTPLPQQNIDTGMGLERITAVVANAPDAYSTELFMPTIRLIEEISGEAYQDLASVHHRILADHARATCFAIADGIMPANDGAGYVIKMLIRRAARQAYLLGIEEPVLHRLLPGVIESMGQAYPELAQARSRIEATLKAEEEQFLLTLGSGMERVRRVLSEVEDGALSGEIAFDLWQTYGFPLDLTVEIAAEHGVSVDLAGFERSRERARRISRSGRGKEVLFGNVSEALERVAREHGETIFRGYEERESEGTVLGLVSGEELLEQVGEAGEAEVILDKTPFYAEGGGQIGDSGKLEWQGGAAIVSGTRRSPQGLLLHRARVVRGSLRQGQKVTARVDPARDETEKHHTATHLLHAALRTVLGDHVAQAGSLVAPDRLRFDFSHPQPLTADERARVETLVNRWIQADFPVNWQVVPLEEARSRGAMMLFGEKYGREVRMVSVGDVPVSLELCGGTHVRATGAIGAFVVTAEEAVSAGVRRIEARVGMAALDYLDELRQIVSELASQLGAPPAELVSRAHKLQAELKAAHRESADLRERLASAQAGGGARQEVREAAGFRYVTASLEGLDSASLRTAADNLLSKSKADLVAVGSEGLLVVKVSKDAQERGAHAGNLIRKLAERAGGKGGGRADMAQAGVKDAERLSEALGAMPEVLSAVAPSS